MPMPKRYTPTSAAADVEAALRLLEGRWKLVILFHLFGGKVMRFSDLERAIPSITQKMLGQQLRSLALDVGFHTNNRPNTIALGHCRKTWRQGFRIHLQFERRSS